MAVCDADEFVIIFPIYYLFSGFRWKKKKNFQKRNASDLIKETGS